MVIRSENWCRLSPYAVKLFIDLYGQYTGNNNGDFTVAWSVMGPRGWRSKATLQKALRELEWYGMIEMTRQGGRNRCSLYGVTFKPIDDCRGKLDVAATRVASRKWAQPVPAFPGARATARPKTKSLPHVAGHPGPLPGAVPSIPPPL
jgi:hypothetical protein